jgi:hypothetical protein
VAHGLSWLLLFWLALTPGASAWAPIAWVHLVALGWFTLVALAVLVHVIPGFTGIRWRWETLARRSLGVYALGVVALVGAFLIGQPAYFPIAASFIVAAAIGYLTPAFATLLGYHQSETRERGIARALALTLVMFAATVALGFALTVALDFGTITQVLRSGQAIHATLGIVGWLTILVTGVSTRTIFPIARARSRWRSAHVTVGSCLFVGTVTLAAGFAFSNALAIAGLILLGIAVALYAADVLDVIRRANNPHRAPQAFVAAAIVWLIAAFVLGAAVVGGGRSELVSALFYLALIGWVGQMVNGHLHHIGVRVLATMALGDDDETRPAELLSAPLSWIAFAASQAAVALGATALLYGARPVLAMAAFSGFGAFIAMNVNAIVALRSARSRSTATGLEVIAK